MLRALVNKPTSGRMHVRCSIYCLFVCLFVKPFVTLRLLSGQLHGRRLALSAFSGFAWGYLRQQLRARRLQKQGKTPARTVMSTAALNAYASAGVMLGVIGWETLIAPAAARSSSTGAVK